MKSVHSAKGKSLSKKYLTNGSYNHHKNWSARDPGHPPVAVDLDPLSGLSKDDIRLAQDLTAMALAKPRHT